MASFTTCHFEDFLSSTSKVTLPQIDFGLNAEALFNDFNDNNCTDETNYELPSVFPFTNKSDNESMDISANVPFGFLLILSGECLFVCALLAIVLYPHVLYLLSQIRRYFTGYTLTFVGIKLPKYTPLSSHSMFDRINTTKTIQTVHTNLLSTDTIGDLKSSVRSSYNVPDNMDILILFAEHIISNEHLTLKHCGIEDRSLLTLALSEKRIVSMSSHWEEYNPSVPVAMMRGIDRLNDDDEVYFDPNGINATFGMYDSDDSDSESEDEEEKCCCEDKPEEKEDLNGPRLGFDVVMQEDNVTVYPMPGCGHVMNPDSLYHYALSQYSDKNTLSIKCPHIYGRDFPCKQRWDYHDILSVLRQHQSTTSTKYDLHKLELLASRNRVQSDCNVQKCPTCHTLYFKNAIDSANLGDIESAEDVERAFKSECVFCSFVCTTYEAEYQPKLEIEEVAAPDMNGLFGGNAVHFDIDSDSESEDSQADPVWNMQSGRMVNAMFANEDSDSESDNDLFDGGIFEEESLSDIEEQEEIIERINSLFDDDEEEIIVPAWKLKLQSISNRINNTYTISKHQITTAIMYMYPVYLYLSTTSHNQMMQDVITLTHDVDSYIHSTFTNTCTTTMEYIHTSLAYIRSIPSKMTTFYNTFGVKEVVVLEISEFQEFGFMKMVPEPVEIYDLENEEMDLFDGGIFGADSDTDSDTESESTVYAQQFGIFGALSDSDSDIDTDDEEMETVRRIESMFGDATPEPEMELVGYKTVTTVKNAFCFGCGVHWEEGHVCDSTFKQDLCDILTMADKKTIGEQQDVPSIRACPNCCQLITHTQACKHMDCRNCRKSFCFVCLKPRLDSGWQCGSYSSKCPGGVVPAQGMESLPDAIVLTKNAFHLY